MAYMRLKKASVATAALYCKKDESNFMRCVLKMCILSIFISLSACVEEIPPENDASMKTKDRVEKHLESDSLNSLEVVRKNKFSALEKMCGDSKISIVCDSNVALQGTLVDCTKTSLQIERKDGGQVNVGTPDEISGQTAVGLGCAISEISRAQYLVVEYGGLPTGCNFCEWFYVFDLSGKQLTKSDPATLFDESLPTGNKQYANNEQYSIVSRSLSLSEAQIDYVDCDAKLSEEHSLPCVKEFINAK